MKTERRFVFLFIVIVLAVILKAGSFSERISTISAFRGAQLESGVFNPLIAGNVNRDGLLNVQIDGVTYSSQEGEVFVNSNMHVMASLNFVRDVFSASAFASEKGKIEIQRNSATYHFTKSKKTGTLLATKSTPESEIKLTEAPEQYDGKYYFALDDLCKLFGYGYSYDSGKVTAALDSTTAEAAKLPKSYDLRSKNRVSKILDQGQLSACWAYASLSALESSLLPEKDVTYDPVKLANRNTYGISDQDEGTYMVAVSSLLSWQGPVKNGDTEIAGHLQEVHFYEKDQMDDIKWAVFKNGGVSTSLYVEVNSSNLSKSDYYNEKTDSYYYNGSKTPNHDVVIIGWDDNYSKSNFAEKVPGDGAYICQNSWGSNFGQDGVFYVSYYDTNVGNFGVSYAKLEKTDNYDHIYQSDLLGEVGKVGYNANTNFFANVYTASEEESLKAVGFYTAGQDTSYTVYVVENFKDTGSLATRRELASGTLHDTGFYTIPLHEAVKLEKGEKFAVVVALKTPGSKHPIAIEYDGNPMTKRVDLKDGMGFTSGNGIEWDSVENKYKANLCLKAYSDTVTEE
jgi:C1A family cysteine protease